MKIIIWGLFALAVLSIFPYSLAADPYYEPVNPFEDTQPMRADSLNMELLGMWNFGYPNAICTDDDYIYLGSGGSVIIFDVSDIMNPQKIGYISFPGTYVRGIYVLDTLMFVGDREKGLRIANISNPAFPIEVGNYESYLSCAVFARRNLAYVLEESKDPLAVGELTIYDVTNPQEPTILAKDTLPKVHLADIVVKDNYAYVANGQGGLRIIDVSDSTNPFETGYYIPPFSAYARSISICNDTLLLLGVEGTYQNGGLWLINIKDPYAPYLMGCDTSFYRGFDVSYYTHFAYVSAITEGIKIIDFIDPLNPYVIGEFIPPTYPLNSQQI